MKVKDLVNSISLPTVVVVYDENHDYIAWITEKLDENHKVLQTVKERLVAGFGEDDVINVVPYLDVRGIIYEFFIKTEN